MEFQSTYPSCMVIELKIFFKFVFGFYLVHNKLYYLRYLYMCMFSSDSNDVRVYKLFEK